MNTINTTCLTLKTEMVNAAFRPLASEWSIPGQLSGLGIKKTASDRRPTHVNYEVESNTRGELSS